MGTEGEEGSVVHEDFEDGVHFGRLELVYGDV